MKKTLFIGCILLAGACMNFVQAQNKFQPLIQRIVLLQTYLGYLKKGYTTVKNGLNTINNIKNGEFNLHDEYFKSLKNVNPKIKKYPRVAQIIAMQASIIKDYKKTYSDARSSKQFTEKEINYMYQVFSNLVEETAKDIDLLMMLVTNGELTMKDEERLQEIDKLFITVQDKHLFIRGFNRDMRMMSLQRKREQKNIDQSGQLHNIQK